MEAALELASGSRWSEKAWELREGGDSRATLTRESWWRRRYRVEASGEAWSVKTAGRGWGRGLVAVARDGSEAARYEPRRGNEDAIELAGGRRLPLRRPRRLHSERVLLEGERELARFHPRGWKRGIDLELGPTGIREEGVTLPVLLACLVLVAERERQQNAAAGAAAGAG